jgi:hypothetical protein
MTSPTPLRPSEFSRQSLRALDASEGRRKRRKRDTTPDALGMELKRALMARAAEDDPAPADFEAWLLKQVLAAPASGPVQAMCAELLDEYRLATLDPGFGRWLADGAFSQDAEPDP